MISPRDFGWWIESTDEEIYGPVTKATMTRLLTEGVVSPNTAVRHCTDASFAPLADQGITDGLNLTGTRRTGDTLGENWPKKTKDRLALAQSDVECAYHRRPAILTCIRCQAPYCAKCQMKKKRQTYFMCKKCQASMYNRRFGAYILDNFLIVMIPTYALGIPVAIAMGPDVGSALINLITFAGAGAFLFRDAALNGAGPGKRLFGLQVVKHDDATPLTYGQGFLRSIAHMIPFFNLVDGSVPYRDPLQRRFGDRWGKTRVIDSERKLDKIRAKISGKLQRKGIELTDEPTMTLQEFAQLG